MSGPQQEAGRQPQVLKSPESEPLFRDARSLAPGPTVAESKTLQLPLPCLLVRGQPFKWELGLGKS